MKNYPNQELQVMPEPKPYHLMTDEELERALLALNLVENDSNNNVKIV